MIGKIDKIEWKESQDVHGICWEYQTLLSKLEVPEEEETK
jgi:hypothetical protein